MSEVKERNINNEKLRDMFYHVPNISELIAIRQCIFIRKVIKGPNAHPPKKVLTTWCNNKGRTGAPIMTNKKSIVNILKRLLTEEMGKNDYGDLNRWIDIAIDEHLRDYKIAKLKKRIGHFRTRTTIPKLQQQQQSRNTSVTTRPTQKVEQHTPLPLQTPTVKI